MAAAPAHAQPGSLDPGFQASALPDQAVRAVAVLADGRSLIGGDFTSIGGTPRMRLSRLRDDGSVDPAFDMTDGPNGSVRALAVQADGRILAGGDFGAVRGLPVRYLARFTSVGAVDEGFNVGAGPNSSVHAVLVLPDNRILVGGQFTEFSGQPRFYLARLESDGRVDPGFSPRMDGAVRSLGIAADGKILVGGDFNSVGGLYRRGIVRLLPGGTVDETFDPAAGPSGIVHAIVPLPDGRSLMAGTFGEMNGVLSPGVSLLGATGLPEPAFRSVLNGPAYGMVRQPDGRILVGGDFTAVGGVAIGRVARLRVDGSLDQSFNTGGGANGTVWGLGLQADGRVLVGGGFAEFAGTPRGRLVRLETASAALGGEIEFGASTFRVSEGQSSAEIEVRRLGTTSLSVTVDYSTRNGTANAGDYSGQPGKLTFGPGETRKTFTISIRADNTREDDETVELLLTNPGGGAEIGGQGTATFILVNDDSPNAAGGQDPDFAGQADGPVHALAIQPDGKVVVGGDFAVVAHSARRRIARLNGDGTVDAGFLAAAWLNGRVLALAVQGDGRILAGGEFTVVNGMTRVRLARFMADGTLDPSFDPGAGPNGTIHSILIQPNGDILVGGSFGAYSGENAPYLVRIFPDGSWDPDFSLTLNGPVYAMAWASDDAVIAGGDFTSASGRYRPRVLRFRTDGRLDDGFDPAAGPNSTVRAVAVQADGGVLIGGSFSEVNGLGRRYLCQLTPGGLPEVDHEVELGATAHAVALQPDGALLAGGDFTTAGGQPANRVVRVREDGSPDPGFNVGGDVDGSVYCLAVALDGRVLVGGAFTRFGGLSRARLVRLEGTTRATGGIIEFANLKSRGAEGQGALVVEVVRGGTTTAAVTVEFATSNGTANAGDYTPQSGKLSFLTGETRKTISVPLRSDGLAEDRETFSLTLTNPAAGAQLGARRTTVVEIVDDDLGTVVGGVDGSFSTSVSGDVYATALQPDGRIVVVGGFAGLRDGSRLRVARLQSDATLDETFLPSAWLDGTAHAVAVSVPADGRVLVGGSFTVANGLPRTRLARFNADGTLDPTFDPGVGPNGTVYALAVQANGDILVGGAFGAYQGQPRGYLVRLFADGNLDPSFAVSVNGPVWCLATGSDGAWMAGGDFTEVGGAVRNRVVRFLGSGRLDTGFDPGAGPNATVRALSLLGDGRVIIGGNFSVVHGVPQGYLSRLNPDGLPDTSYRPGFNNAVYGLAVQPDGRVIAGGEFTRVGEIVANRVVRLLGSGAVDPFFDPGQGANAAVHTLALQLDGNLVVGGSFTEFNGVNRQRLVRLQGLSVAAGGEIEFGAPAYRVAESQASASVIVKRLGTSSEVVTVEYLTRNGTANAGDYTSQSGTLIFGAGETTRTLLIPIRPDLQVEGDETVQVLLQNPGGGAELGGQRATVLVIGDDDNATSPGGLDLGFLSGTSGRVSALAVQADGRIIVAGSFWMLGGQPRTGVGRLLPDGSVDPTFMASAWANAAVHSATILEDGRILIGGDFTMVNGVIRNRLAAFRPDGTLDAAFDPGIGPNGSVYALLPVSGGGVLAGGSFSHVNNEARSGLVRLYVDGTVDADFRTTTDGPVWTLAVDAERRIVVGGEFARIGGSPRVRVARLLPAGDVDQTFDPGAGPNSTVRAVLPDREGGVFIGGQFSQVGGVARPLLGRLLPTGEVDPAYVPEVNGVVYALALETGGKLIAVGEFTRVGGQDVGRVARFHADGTPDPEFETGTGANGTVFTVATLGDGQLLIGGDFTQFNGLARERLARVFATDPAETSPFSFTSIAAEFGVVRLTCTGAAGRRYVLESADQPGLWSPVATNTPSAPTFQFTDPQPVAGHRFYRLRSP